MAKKHGTETNVSLARLSGQGYFMAIKKAKKFHWADFLAKTTPHNICTAKKFVAPRKTPRFPELPGAESPVEIKEALLNHFFPPKPELARLSRQGYFMAVKKAIKFHWADLLAQTTPHDIWTAKKLVAPRKTPRFPELPGAESPVEINKALLNHFFPPKPELPRWGRLHHTPSAIPLTKEDITAALANPPPHPHRAPMGYHTRSEKCKHHVPQPSH